VIAGSRLKPLITQEGTTWKTGLQPYWGKPAVRNDRGIEETSASCQARFAPRPYSTLTESVKVRTRRYRQHIFRVQLRMRANRLTNESGSVGIVASYPPIDLESNSDVDRGGHDSRESLTNCLVAVPQSSRKLPAHRRYVRQAGRSCGPTW